MLKKKLLILLAIMLTFSAVSWGVIRVYGRKPLEISADTVIVTSFYPVHLLTSQLVDGAKGVRLVYLTENHVGCLHDYQLTTRDMLTLESADMLIINGGDMELFATEAATGQELTVIDASAGMDFLEGIAHEHTHESEADEQEEHVHEDEHVHDETEEAAVHEAEVHDEDEHVHALNGHVWLNTERYAQQLYQVKEALCRLDAANAPVYQKNYEEYSAKLQAFTAEYQSALEQLHGCEVVIFHDAFAYMCEELGMEAVHSVSLDADTALSAAEIAEVTDELRLHGIRYLLAEETTGAVAEQIAEETGCKVIYLNPLTSGENEPDAYLTVMRQNMKKLQEIQVH